VGLLALYGRDSLAQMESEHSNEEVLTLMHDSQPKWWKDSGNIKLMIMVGLTAIFMGVELAFGFITDSLALISDAFHMFSDVVSLIVGIAARVVR